MILPSLKEQLCGAVIPRIASLIHALSIATESKFSYATITSRQSIDRGEGCSGRKLFNDKSLSLDRTIACSHCDQPANAMGDGVAYSRGIDGRLGRRNAVPLFNLAWKSSFFWDGRSPSLRDQALHPIQDENEMNQSLEQMLDKLKQSPFYQNAFEAAYNSPEIYPERVGLAIENFLLTKLSFDSKFDQSFIGQAALTAKEKRGLKLFMTEYEPRSKCFGADCFHCHGGPLFSDQRFHNNGLDNLDGCSLTIFY